MFEIALAGKSQQLHLHLSERQDTAHSSSFGRGKKAVPIVQRLVNSFIHFREEVVQIANNSDSDVKITSAPFPR